MFPQFVDVSRSFEWLLGGLARHGQGRGAAPELAPTTGTAQASVLLAACGCWARQVAWEGTARQGSGWLSFAAGLRCMSPSGRAMRCIPASRFPRSPRCCTASVGCPAGPGARLSASAADVPLCCCIHADRPCTPSPPADLELHCPGPQPVHPGALGGEGPPPPPPPPPRVAASFVPACRRWQLAGTRQLLQPLLLLLQPLLLAPAALTSPPALPASTASTARPPAGPPPRPPSLLQVPFVMLLQAMSQTLRDKFRDRIMRDVRPPCLGFVAFLPVSVRRSLLVAVQAQPLVAVRVGVPLLRMAGREGATSRPVLGPHPHARPSALPPLCQPTAAEAPHGGALAHRPPFFPICAALSTVL